MELKARGTPIRFESVHQTMIVFIWMNFLCFQRETSRISSVSGRFVFHVFSENDDFGVTFSAFFGCFSAKQEKFFVLVL